MLLANVSLHAQVERKRQFFGGLNHKAQLAHDRTAIKVGCCHGITVGRGLTGLGKFMIEGCILIKIEALRACDP